MPLAEHTTPAEPQGTPSFWLLQTAGWLAYAVAMSASRVGRFPASYMVVSKGTLALLGFAISALVLRPAYRRLLGTDAPIVRVIGVTVVVSYAAAALWTAADNVADAPIAAAFLGRSTTIRSAGQLFDGALYNAFTLLAWSLLYVGVKHHLALAAQRERALRAEALAHRARLDALRYQLDPHFLFNALNAVSTLVVEGRNTEANRMLARLGDLLRATLERPTADEVSLGEELALLERYVDVESARLGDRLTVNVDVAAEARDARVPVLLLQPLVENAVRHAVAPREEGGRVTVSAARENGILRLVVEDDGPGLNGAPNAGVGLANTRERLGRLYGDRHRFALGPGSHGGCRVEIELPYAPC